MAQLYHRLPNEGQEGGTNYNEANDMPNLPPMYDEVNVGPMEQFEIDDEDYEMADVPTGFLTRASKFTKNIASSISRTVVRPAAKLIDPIYEGMLFVSLQYERSILKIGNPLVVKRLLYVAFMVAVIYFVSKYSVNEGINGASGGAFSSGIFYDLDKLSSMIQDHVDAKIMNEHLEYFSSMPHVAGTSGDLALSKYIETYMRNNGVKNVESLELQSFLNYPSTDKKHTRLITSDESFEATLNEMEGTEMEYMGYNQNSLNTDSEVEGHMIYANHGTEKDFEDLKNLKIPLKDSILLIKYGGSIPEPNKVEIATSLGAKAIVFISRQFTMGPDDDKQEFDDVIQRQNVGNIRYSTGDVLTPGWSSEDGYVSRLLWFKSKATPKISTIPISHKDGMTLISKLGQSGHKFENDLYSGDMTDDKSKRLRLRVGNSRKETHQIWNVVGSIPGRDQKSKSLIIGSARDSPCFGTMSSNTGSVVLLELIRIFTTIQRKFNWSPARTITFVSFDASNYNLAGLTEWIEEKKKFLRHEAYAYLDLSDVVSGDQLSIKANPFLHDIIKSCLKSVGSSTIQARGLDKVQHKDKSLSLYELFQLQNKGLDKISNNMLEEKNYLPFINLLNVPSMEIKFKGKEYFQHSCYDNFDNFNKFKIDPVMDKHGQIVELIGKIVLNVAEQAFIPFKFEDFVDRVHDYQDDLDKYINKALAASSHSDKPQIDFGRFIKALNTLKEVGLQFDQYVSGWKEYISRANDIEPSVIAMKRWRWNDCLTEFNSGFISTDEQSARPGYSNMLFGSPQRAPINDNQWQWNTFPTIRDYVDKGDFGRVQAELDKIADIMIKGSTFFSL